MNLFYETETKTHPCHYIRDIFNKPLVTVVTEIHGNTGKTLINGTVFKRVSTPMVRLVGSLGSSFTCSSTVETTTSFTLTTNTTIRNLTTELPRPLIRTVERGRPPFEGVTRSDKYEILPPRTYTKSCCQCRLDNPGRPPRCDVGRLTYTLPTVRGPYTFTSPISRSPFLHETTTGTRVLQ